jgi:hypothetical protein
LKGEIDNGVERNTYKDNEREACENRKNFGLKREAYSK